MTIELEKKIKTPRKKLAIEQNSDKKKSWWPQEYFDQMLTFSILLIFGTNLYSIICENIYHPNLKLKT